MKTTTIILALIAIFSLAACKDDQPTKATPYDKYNIHNDPDWIAITDIDTVEACIATSLFDDAKGLLIKSENEYLNYFNLSLQDEDYVYSVTKFPQYTNCTTTYQPSNIDYSKRHLILFDLRTGGQPICDRSIYRNNTTEEILYLVSIQKTTLTLENSGFGEEITIPKIPSGYSFIVDTILVRI